MEYMTYKQFEKIINELGYKVEHDFHVYVQNNSGRTFACISKVDYKQLNLIWPKTKELTDAEKDLMSDACWQLASTPLSKREELKKYRLKVKPQYQPFFSDGHIYLRKAKYSDMFGISNIDYDYFDNSVFTEDELTEISEKYDLSLFEKVEVEDEQ